MERNTSGDGVDEMNKHLSEISMSSVSEKISDQRNSKRIHGVAKRGNIQTAKTIAAPNKPANTSSTTTHQLTEKDILDLPIVVPLRDAPKFVTSGLDNSVVPGNVPIVMPPNLSMKHTSVTSTFQQKETLDVKGGAWREEALIELPILSSFEETSKYQSCLRNEKNSLFASTSSNELSEDAQKTLKGTSKQLISNGGETCRSGKKVISVKIPEGDIPKPSSSSKDKIALKSKKISKALRKTTIGNKNSKADERKDMKHTNFKSKPKDDNKYMRSKKINQDIKTYLEDNETTHISGNEEQNSGKKIFQHLLEDTPLLEIISKTEQNDNTPMCSQRLQKILPDFQQSSRDDSAINKSKGRIKAAGLIETQEETCGHCFGVNAQKMINETNSCLTKSDTAEGSKSIKCQQKIPEPALLGPSNITKSQNICEVDNASKCLKKENKKLTSTGAIPKKLQLSSDSKFLKGFNPDLSRREAKKYKKLDERYKKVKNYHKKRLYDDCGLVLETGEDLCDCLIKDCPGCHFPCPKCRSNKCGHVCRINRTWMYDEYEIEGTGITIKRQT